MVVGLSLSARILVNVEALNMAERVGDVARHRRAPVVISSGGNYSIVYVPVASGESIAHHYQRLLASIASSMGFPVTKMDLQGYFLKYADNDIIKNWYSEVKTVTDINDPCEVESMLIMNSVVADVTGFLYTNKLVKRMSRIRFSYLVPTYDAIAEGAVGVTPQFHVRYAPPQAAAVQRIYYVESGSALFALSATLAASDIARLEYCADKKYLNDRNKRVEAAVKTLVAMIDGLAFGAKKSRYSPIWEVKSLVVSVSEGPIEFTVSPGASKDYITNTLTRAKTVKNILGSSIEAFIFDGEGLNIPEVSEIQVKRFSTHTEAIVEAGRRVLELLEQKST